jgi:hypothetical protein
LKVDENTFEITISFLIVNNKKHPAISGQGALQVVFFN